MSGVDHRFQVLLAKRRPPAVPEPQGLLGLVRRISRAGPSNG